MGFGVLARKLKRNYRDYGLGVALKKTIGYLFSTIFEIKTYRIYMIDFGNYVPTARNDNGFAYRFISGSDSGHIREIERMEEWLDGSVKERLAKGGICLVATIGGEFAGFNLASFGDVYMPIVRTRRVFREGEAWSEQITVDPAYRGKGLAMELRYRMFEELIRRGYRKFYGGTLPSNVANRKFSRKVGFKEIADLRYVNVLGVRRTFCRKIKNDLLP